MKDRPYIAPVVVDEEFMPQICSFFGIKIYIFYDEHPKPHFHAKYEGRRWASRYRAFR